MKMKKNVRILIKNKKIVILFDYKEEKPENFDHNMKNLRFYE